MSGSLAATDRPAVDPRDGCTPSPCDPKLLASPRGPQAADSGCAGSAIIARDGAGGPASHDQLTEEAALLTWLRGLGGLLFDGEHAAFDLASWRSSA
jgi:hypothetical protein